VKARFLQSDGSYERAKPARKEKALRSQLEFIALAEAEPEAPRERADGHVRHPQVKLAPSPFAVLKPKGE
jgi:hypothetical protein